VSRAGALCPSSSLEMVVSRAEALCLSSSLEMQEMQQLNMYVVSHNYSFPFCIERRPDNGSGDDLLVHSKSYSTPSVIRHHYTVTCTGTSTGAVAFGGMNLHESFAASFFRFRFEIDVNPAGFPGAASVGLQLR
jgi:hypothetical protein